MLVNKTDSDYLENTIKLSGTEHSTYNYSIDNIKKAAFLDELNNVLNLNKSVDFNPIIDYLKNRIDEINKRYS